LNAHAIYVLQFPFPLRARADQIEIAVIITVSRGMPSARQLPEGADLTSLLSIFSPGKGSTTLGKFSGSTLQPYSRQTGFSPCIDLKSIQVITGQALESSRLYLSHNPVCQYRIVSIRVSIIFQGRASLIRRHAVKWPSWGPATLPKDISRLIQ
jgi:hypothetical protein